MFHPSFFESVKGVPEEKRILLNVKNEGIRDITYSMNSPGKYNFSDNDSAKEKDSNTKYLFRDIGETPLTFLFFSDSNINNIQKLIKFLIFKETSHIIDNQSKNELMIIMRSIFIEYNKHPKLITENMSENEKKKLLDKYKEEVFRLNDIVVNLIVPKIISQLKQYLDYLRDSSAQPYRKDIPKNTSISGEREYKSITQVLLGGDL